MDANQVDNSKRSDIEPSDVVEQETPQPESLFRGATTWLNQGTSWGASFLNSAREKTINTFDLVKKDLSELTDAMAAEVTDLTNAAKEGLETAATAMKHQAQVLEKLVTPDEEEKEFVEERTDEPEQQEKSPLELSKAPAKSFGWVRNIVGTVTDTVKTLAMEETTMGEENITEAIRKRPTRNTAISKSKLIEIQCSESTYEKLPENFDVFEQWLARFRIDEHKYEIDLLMSTNAVVKEIFSKLVPQFVDYETFWTRYFFTVDMAELDEELKKSFCDGITVNAETEGRKLSISKKNSPSSEESVVVVDEPTSPSQSDWSVCSDKNDVEELASNEEKDEPGPLTPRASEVEDVDDSKARKEEGWVDWDE